MIKRSSDISEEMIKLIREKIEAFNLRRVTDNGRYCIVFPTDKTLYYTLWFNNPHAIHYPYICISNLELDILASLNKSMRLIQNSFLPLCITDSDEPLLHNTDDIIMFGKYRGRHLQDIYSIDPRYVSWLADKFTPTTKTEERFKELAVSYNKVYLDLQIRKKYKKKVSDYVGKQGDKLHDLELTIIRVRIEDDSYKTRLYDGVEYFYVDQLITATDTAGNLYLTTVKAKDRSLESRTLSPGTYAYRTGEIMHISSAKVLKHIESFQTRYTKLGYLKFKD